VRKTTVLSPIKSTKTILEKIIKKTHLEKYYSNSQYFVRKATMLSPYDLALL
jgi:hypothetical protein